MENDEKWTEADDAEVAFEAIPFDHPVRLSSVFLTALSDIPQFRTGLETLVTPESLDSWGDFTEVAAIKDGLSISSVARSYPTAPDVAYVYTIRDEPTARFIDEPEILSVEHIFTWIWRPELEMWRLQSFGVEDPLELLPRTSAGVAPDIGAVPPRFAT